MRGTWRLCVCPPCRGRGPSTFYHSLVGSVSTRCPQEAGLPQGLPATPPHKRPRKVRERRGLCQRPSQAQAWIMVALLPRCPKTGCPCHPCSPRNPGLRPNLRGRAGPPTPTPGPQPCVSTGADGRGQAWLQGRWRQHPSSREPRGLPAWPAPGHPSVCAVTPILIDLDHGSAWPLRTRGSRTPLSPTWGHKETVLQLLPRPCPGSAVCQRGNPVYPSQLWFLATAPLQHFPGRAVTNKEQSFSADTGK